MIDLGWLLSLDMCGTFAWVIVPLVGVMVDLAAGQLWLRMQKSDDIFMGLK